MFSEPAFHGELPESKSSCVLQDLHVDFFLLSFCKITSFLMEHSLACENACK